MKGAALSYARQKLPVTGQMRLNKSKRLSRLANCASGSPNNNWEENHAFRPKDTGTAFYCPSCGGCSSRRNESRASSRPDAAGRKHWSPPPSRKARSRFSIRNSATRPASCSAKVSSSATILGPNFKFNNLRKGTGATVAQIRQEIQAGKHTVDILIVSAPGFFDEAVQARRLRSARQRLLEEPRRAGKEGRTIFQLPLRRGAVRLHLPAGVERILSRHGELHGQLLCRRGQAGAEGQDHRLRYHQELHLHQHRACRSRKPA